MLKKLDLYIIRKFLGTFFLSIALIISIAIVFDISEKLEDFISKQAPISKIIFDYYLNFIPFFANMFSPLFTFISVIFFTSKMASNTEIVAILASGVSFNRLLRPYLLSALFIAVISLLLNYYVIPKANAKRLQFEEIYIRNKLQFTESNVHIQDSPGTFVYFEGFNNFEKIGYKFSLEKFKGEKMYYKINADFIRWDSVKSMWSLHNYYERHFSGLDEKLAMGVKKDTVLNVSPREFASRLNIIEAMDINELNRFIADQKLKGSDEIAFYEVEKHRRASYPFATFILTIIGVAISSRKVRGGIGMHIGFGLAISFSYLMFMQVFTTFAYYSNFPPLLAVWLPNIIYLVLSMFLLRLAPK
jgi:lipopolysaccharide export system permease protein